MAGRRPTPNTLKILAGNPGHRPINTEEPTPEKVAPEKPKGMAAAANREWDFMVPILLRLGVLSQIDGKALAAYCDAYAMWERARKEINKYGLVIKTPKCDKEGNVIIVHGIDTDGEIPDDAVMNSAGQRGRVLYELKANPAVGVYNTFAKLLKSYLIEFGLTPASRSKLKICKPPVKDPMVDFLSRGGQAATEQVKQDAPLAFNTGVPVQEPISDASTNFDA